MHSRRSVLVFLSVSVILVGILFGQDSVGANFDNCKDTIPCRGDTIEFTVYHQSCCLLDSTFISIESSLGSWDSIYIHHDTFDTTTDTCINSLSYFFWLDDSFFSMPDTIILCITDAAAECSTGTVHLDSSVCCTMYVDCGGPAIDSFFPPNPVFCPPDTVLFIVEDTCNLSIDSVIVDYAGENYSLDSNLWFLDTDTIYPDTIAFVFSADLGCNNTTTDTVCITIWNEDSCENERCFPFDYHRYGPQAQLIDTIGVDTVYCNPETLALFIVADSCEGLDTNSILITLNSDTIPISDDTLWMGNDTLYLFVNDYTLNIDTNYFCLVAARDTAGCELADTVCGIFIFAPEPPNFYCDSISGTELYCVDDTLFFWSVLDDTCWELDSAHATIFFIAADTADGVDSIIFSTEADTEYLRINDSGDTINGMIVYDAFGFSPFCRPALICVEGHFSFISEDAHTDFECCFVDSSLSEQWNPFDSIGVSFTTRCGNCYCELTDTTDTTHCCPNILYSGCHCEDTLIYPAGDSGAGFAFDTSGIYQLDSVHIVITPSDTIHDTVEFTTDFSSGTPTWMFLTPDSVNVGIALGEILSEGIYNLCLNLWYSDSSGEIVLFPPSDTICPDSMACTILPIKYDCTPPELWYGWISDMPDSYFCAAESVIVVLCDSIGVFWGTLGGTPPFIVIEGDAGSDTFLLTDTSLTNIGDTLIFFIEPGMLSWLDSGNAVLEIHAEDYCGNQAIFYDTFYIECRGPLGEVIECLPDTEWHICNSLVRDTIGFAIYDSIFGPVIDSTVEVIVWYRDSGIDTLRYGTDSMYWSWDTSAGEGTLDIDLISAYSIIESSATPCSLTFCLSDDISDSLYSMTNTGICCSVNVDCYPPTLNNINPTTSWTCDSIYAMFYVSDDCSGIDSTSAHAEIRCPSGTTDITSEITYISPGFWLDTISISIDEHCSTINDGDTVSVCLISFSDYAGNPMSSTGDSCAEFIIDCSPPEVYSISADTWFCDTTEITIYVSDTLSGLNTSSITITISGCDTDTILDTLISLSGDTDSFTFSLDSTMLIPPCSTGDSIQICISGVTDNAGNTQDNACFSIYVYCQRPEGHWIFPSPGCTNLKNEE